MTTDHFESCCQACGSSACCRAEGERAATERMMERLRSQECSDVAWTGGHLALLSWLAGEFDSKETPR